MQSAQDGMWISVTSYAGQLGVSLWRRHFQPIESAALTGGGADLHEDQLNHDPLQLLHLLPSTLGA